MVGIICGAGWGRVYSLGVPSHILLPLCSFRSVWAYPVCVCVCGLTLCVHVCVCVCEGLPCTCVRARVCVCVCGLTLC